MFYYYFNSCLRPYLLAYSQKQWLEKLFSTVLTGFFVSLLLGQPTGYAQAPAQSQPGKRVALLIGNAAYKGDMNASTLDWTRLQNAANDAQAVGNELTRLGFRPADVQVLQNTSLREMRLALVRFSKLAEKADQVVFYFSGHGAQHRTLNYLIPVDAPARDRDLATLGVDAIRLEEVLDAVSVGAGQKVVMIDACRTLPGAKGDAGGLANPESQRKLPAKTVVVFAAAAGQSALDGRGQANGYFAQGVLAGFQQNDTSLRNVIEVAETKVAELSNNTQEVTVYGSSLAQRDFAFAPRKLVPMAVDPRLAQLERENEELKKRVATPQPQPQPQPQPGQETPAYPGGPIMVTLPKGSYLRGSQDEDGRDNDEGPVKTVTIAYHIQMGKTEVTRGQFAEFVRAKNYKTDAESSGQGCAVWDGKTWAYDSAANWRSPGFIQPSDAHPVVCISWNDGQQYLNWLNEKLGISPTAANRFRYPSEAEWEFAARGVTSPTQSRSGAQHLRFYWGNDAGYKQMCSYANGLDKRFIKQYPGYASADCDDDFTHTAPVASFGNTAQTRHPFGLHDMLGNAWEWVQDCFEENYSSGQPTDGTAHEPAAKAKDCRRVLRGGGWYSSPQYLRSAYRVRRTPDVRDSGIGLRPARTVF